MLTYITQNIYKMLQTVPRNEDTQLKIPFVLCSNTFPMLENSNIYKLCCLINNKFKENIQDCICFPSSSNELYVFSRSDLIKVIVGECDDIIYDTVLQQVAKEHRIGILTESGIAVEHKDACRNYSSSLEKSETKSWEKMSVC